MKKINLFGLMMLGLLVCSFTFANIAACPSPTPPNPVKMLQDTSNQTIQAIQAKKAVIKTDPNVSYQIIRQMMIPHVDLAYIAQRCLGKAWNTATPAQQKQFLSGLTTFLTYTYGSALTAYTGQLPTFNMRGDYKCATKVTVQGQLQQGSGSDSGPPINVNYSLNLVDGEWKVADISVEGISMLQSFQSQFASMLKAGGMDKVLTMLDQHNQQIAQHNLELAKKNNA